MSVESHDPTVPNQTVLGSDFVCRQIQIFFPNGTAVKCWNCRFWGRLLAEKKTGPPNQITKERTLDVCQRAWRKTLLCHAQEQRKALHDSCLILAGGETPRRQNEQTGSNCAPLWHLVLTQKVSVGSGQKTLGPRQLKGRRKRGAAPAR